MVDIFITLLTQPVTSLKRVNVFIYYIHLISCVRIKLISEAFFAFCGRCACDISFFIQLYKTTHKVSDLGGTRFSRLLKISFFFFFLNLSEGKIKQENTRQEKYLSGDVSAEIFHFRRPTDSVCGRDVNGTGNSLFLTVWLTRSDDAENNK